MPRAIESMRRREEELSKAILHLSEKTNGFTDPRIVLIGGYALRVFIPFSRFTRDCDFIMRKKNGWNLDKLKAVVPKGYSIESEQRNEKYGFARWVKLVSHDKARVKVSIDFMEGEIRGRESNEVILIDESMIKNARFESISVANKDIRVTVPDYRDYFIMKVISSRPSDIRDIASLVENNGIPSGLTERIEEILTHPSLFKQKINQELIPEIKKRTFLDSWKGTFATTRYTDNDKEKVIQQLEKLV